MIVGTKKVRFGRNSDLFREITQVCLWLKAAVPSVAANVAYGLNSDLSSTPADSRFGSTRDERVIPWNFR